jgi:chloramphenicol-sensitive protein RarD
MTTNKQSEQRTGVINAICAYLLWGLAPIYFKLIEMISAQEIMIHRILWSSVLLLVIIVFSQKWHKLIALLRQPLLIAKLSVTASFLAFNWFLFIWAVNNDHLLDASLGYFINPLFSVALGVFFLGEKLRKWQFFAVILAVSGVLIQLIALGSLPMISLGLAGSFGLYGLLRKKLNVDSFLGLFIESLMMLPIALLYWQFFVSSETSNLFANEMTLNGLLICTGIVTTAPLLCFTAAAKRLTLSSVGFFQYIGPSIMFILATLYYQETLLAGKLITFVLIWLALIVYSADSIHFHRRIKSKSKSEGVL